MRQCRTVPGARAAQAEKGIAAEMLFQMNVEDTEEVDGAAQGKHSESKGSQGHAEKAPLLGLAMVQGGSVFFYPLFVPGLTERRLNGNLKAPPVILLEGYEAERLFAHCNRPQHFRGGKHRPGLGDEHQLHLGIRLQWAGHAEHAPGQGDDFQLCLSSAAVVKSKHGRRDVGQIVSWSSTIGVGLGEGVHNPSMLLAPAK